MIHVSKQARSGPRAFQVPQPAREAVPGVVVALALLVAVGFDLLPQGVGVVAAAACVLFALARAGLALRRRRALERRADAILRVGASVHPQSALLVWRAGRLTSAQERTEAARSLQRIISDLEHPAVFSAVPLNRRAIAPQLPRLRALAQSVGAVEHSVAPRGMVLVNELLTDGYRSPLYAGGSCVDAAGALDECLHALASDHGRRN